MHSVFLQHNEIQNKALDKVKVLTWDGVWFQPFNCGYHNVSVIFTVARTSYSQNVTFFVIRWDVLYSFRIHAPSHDLFHFQIWTLIRSSKKVKSPLGEAKLNAIWDLKTRPTEILIVSSVENETMKTKVKAKPFAPNSWKLTTVCSTDFHERLQKVGLRSQSKLRKSKNRIMPTKPTLYPCLIFRVWELSVWTAYIL